MTLSRRGSERPPHRLISSRHHSDISSSDALQNSPFSSIIVTFSYMLGVQLLLFSPLYQSICVSSAGNRSVVLLSQENVLLREWLDIWSHVYIGLKAEHIKWIFVAGTDNCCKILMRYNSFINQACIGEL